MTDHDTRAAAHDLRDDLAAWRWLRTRRSSAPSSGPGSQTRRHAAQRRDFWVVRTPVAASACWRAQQRPCWPQWPSSHLLSLCARHHRPRRPSSFAHGNYIVATVVDPYAAEQELDAAFAAHGLNIMLELVPLLPSMAGSSSTWQLGAGQRHRAPDSATKQAPGGPLPIGLVSPSTSGPGRIMLAGRRDPGDLRLARSCLRPWRGTPRQWPHGDARERGAGQAQRPRPERRAARWRVVKPAKGGLPTPVASPTSGASPAPGICKGTGLRIVGHGGSPDDPVLRGI